MAENIKEVLERLFFKKISDSWIGSIGNNKFIIKQDKPTDREFILKTSCLTAGSNEELLRFLDEEKNKGKVKTFNVNGNLLSITYALSNNDSEFEYFLKDISDILTKLEAKDVCFSCNKVKETDSYKVKGEPTFLCYECVDNIKAEAEKEKNASNNYLTGALCCIIGALVGSGLWILIGYFNFYASIAGYFIAYCAFSGYNFGKGKATKIGAVINIFAIIFALLFAEYIGLFIGIRKEFEIDFLSFVKLSPTFFSNPTFIKSLIPSLGFGFLFAGLGSYKIVKSIFTKANELSNNSIEKI